MLAPAQVWLVVEPVDMRLGIDGLSAHIQQALGRPPCDGTAYAFRNRRGSRLKLLQWYGTGVWLSQRRLHQGHFRWPRADDRLFTLTQALPRIEHRHEPETCTCSQCGGGVAKIGEDISEQLDVEPAKFFVHRHIRPQYACRPCVSITAAPGPLWQDYAEALIQSLSVRKAAIHCGVSKNTAFLWRHRFLSRIAGHHAQHASGIVEADETFFLEAFKGQRELPRPPRKRGGSAKRRGLPVEQIPVLLVRDRSGQQADFKLEKLDAAHVGERLRPLVDVDAILCTDSAGVYAHFAKATGITHQPINPSQKRRVDGAFHIQNVNAYDSRLKSWMIPFHGVAT